MIYEEEEFLQLSGIQHFSFCRRQWGLIHIERQWFDNVLTVQGNLLHEKAHDCGNRDLRGDRLTVRGMQVFSPTLGVSGACDVVEFRRSPDGVPLSGREGLWVPYPVEYKRGVPKSVDADRLQLCAQAMCLEEMLCVDIPEGALFYGEPRRRERVAFTEDFREKVRACFEEMYALAARSHTPNVKPTKQCGGCSLREICLSQLFGKKSVGEYLRAYAEEEQCGGC